MTKYNPFSLENKEILITGASSGIGRATAVECSRLGATLFITGRNESELIKTISLLEGNTHKYIVADLTTEEGLSHVVKTVNKLDGLFFSAGIMEMSPILFINKKKVETIFDTNFIAPSLLTKDLVKNKKMKSGASIVFVTSVAGTKSVGRGNTIYATSKAAMFAMSRSMAVEFSSKKIRVNTIAPAMTETPLIHDEIVSSEDLENDKKNYLLKRYAKPEEIAFAGIYFLSDASAFCTGSELIVDGGCTVI